VQAQKQGSVKNYILDAHTSSKTKIINRLRKLKSTVRVIDNGAYKEDAFFSQIYIESRLTEEQLDRWLYEVKGIEYAGLVEASRGRQE